MSGSCCGSSSKCEPAKDAKVAAPQPTEVVTEQPAAKSSECCNDKPAKHEKQECACNC
jgi:hypothetical protein